LHVRKEISNCFGFEPKLKRRRHLAEKNTLNNQKKKNNRRAKGGIQGPTNWAIKKQDFHVASMEGKKATTTQS